MTIDLSIRKLIKSHYDDGKNAYQIYQALNKTVKMRTIYNWLRVIDKTGTVSAKKIPGRPRSKRTKELIQKVKRNFKKNKRKKSVSQLAAENDCHRRTIGRVISDDLSLKAYRIQTCPALTKDHKIKRKRFCGWIRKNIGRNAYKKIMFSDEKIFDGDGQLNPKNDVIYAESREDANQNGGLFEKRKFPLKVMVWCGITFNGATELVVLPPKTSFDSDFYIQNVIPLVKREGNRLIGKDFMYQQDGATCHTSEAAINAIREAGISLLGGKKWPPNSPDLSPMDFFFWNEVAKRIPKKKFSNREELIRNIKKAVDEIPVKMIRESFKKFKPLCLAVEKKNGELI